MRRNGLLDLRRQSGPWLKYVLVQLLQAESAPADAAQGFLDPKAFPHPFIRRTSRMLNKCWRMMRGGKHEAGRFMHELKYHLIAWVGTPPPSSPGAIAMPRAPESEMRRVG